MVAGSTPADPLFFFVTTRRMYVCGFVGVVWWMWMVLVCDTCDGMCWEVLFFCYFVILCWNSVIPLTHPTSPHIYK